MKKLAYIHFESYQTAKNSDRYVTQNMQQVTFDNFEQIQFTLKMG